MTTIELIRPKTVDLEELFELKIWVAPALDACQIMPKKQIMIGQTYERWVASEPVMVNGIIIWWQKRTDTVPLMPMCKVHTGDTLHVKFNWRE